MSASIRLAWREGVKTELCEDGEFRVESPAARVTLRRNDGARAEVWERLALPGEDESALADQVLESGGAGALSQWYYDLQRLSSRGLIVRSVHDGGTSLATLVPLAPEFRLEPNLGSIASERSVQLSRFAFLRRIGTQLVLESPASLARVVLDDARVAALLGSLAAPGTVDEHQSHSQGLSAEAIPLLLELLRSAGMLEWAGFDVEPAALRSWEFHDLLFHARSRKGRSDAPFGAAYRLEAGPPPAFPIARSEQSFELYRPDLERIGEQEPSLTRVLESRHSIREYGKQPMTAQQLGEFLYRVARVKAVRQINMETSHGVVALDVASRPFPAGGSLYELEFYLAVQACEGLEPGLYHYDARGHRLERLGGPTADLAHLFRDAAGSAAIPAESIQLVVVLAARIRRLTWKYASIAYALTLKHVGVVYQTMYLVATAMNLAPCALGGGDADLFARLAEADYYEQSSVGEFLLGSRM